jgi:hypothetical protein
VFRTRSAPRPTTMPTANASTAGSASGRSSRAGTTQTAASPASDSVTVSWLRRRACAAATFLTSDPAWPPRVRELTAHLQHSRKQSLPTGHNKRRFSYPERAVLTSAMSGHPKCRGSPVTCRMIW